MDSQTLSDRDCWTPRLPVLRALCEQRRLSLQSLNQMISADNQNSGNRSQCSANLGNVQAKVSSMFTISLALVSMKPQSLDLAYSSPR